MARPLRLHYPGAFYHVTVRGNERTAIFRSEADRKAFLQILSQAVDRSRLDLYAYELMGSHYPMLLGTPDANLSLAIWHLMGCVPSILTGSPGVWDICSRDVSRRFWWKDRYERSHNWVDVPKLIFQRLKTNARTLRSFLLCDRSYLLGVRSGRW